MDYLLEGVRALCDFSGGGWKCLVMYVIGIALIWLAIKKEYEPSLLLPMGFGAILVNLPLSGVLNQNVGGIEAHGIIEWLFEVGIEASEAMPILLFIGIGAMIDFGPLLSNPSMFLYGAAAQFGIFAAILLAALLGFDIKDAASIGIIGAADGPTAILVSQVLKSKYVGAIAVAAYTLLGRVVRESASTTVYTYLVYVTCASVLLGICIWQGYGVLNYGASAIIVGFLLAIFSTILGHSIFSWCLKYFTPSFVSASKLCEPVAAGVMAVFLFSEYPSMMQMAGAALILGGVLYYSKLERT